MTEMRAATDLAAFIRANTKLMRPPLVPELELYLAEESLPLWQKTEDELGALGVAPPFWAFAWAGGQALARYVLDNRELVTGKAVLDVGSGSGLSAIAAGLAGASRVIANDIDPLAVAACQLNADANQVTLEISGLDMIGGGLPRHGGLRPVVDMLFLADVFYERELSDHVMDFARAAAAQGSRVLIGDPNRSYFPVDQFAKIAEYAVPVTRELEDNEIKQTAVWQFSD